VLDERLSVLAQALQARCVARGLHLVTVESCTGGLVGHAITSNPGSSAYYLGGLITYADALKRDLAGVPADVLEAHGAVSAQVALAMADGARRRMGADIAVSVTGVAGPDGGSEAKPVGLTYIGVADGRGTDVRRFAWAGDRAANQLESAVAALETALERVGE
jgi:competence/damage-inducible protein CinA C-terminal domain